MKEKGNMKIIRTVKEMQETALELKRKGKEVGLVPTMGALHEGHLSLVRRAKKENDVVVVSVFVNPTQFGPNEDYLRYPRPFEKDKKLCLREKADIIFNPSVKEMYPEGYKTYIKADSMGELLCGKFRAGHFRGVVTVVAKLFNITRTDRAYFGEKDYQQLKIIQKMAGDLNLPVEICPCETLREKDGLAMSSRNIYLKKHEREKANGIYRALSSVKKLIRNKQITSINSAISYVKRELSAVPGAKIDYVSFCDTETLEELKKVVLPMRLLVAVRVGKTRLIDNIAVD